MAFLYCADLCQICLLVYPILTLLSSALRAELLVWIITLLPLPSEIFWWPFSSLSRHRIIQQTESGRSLAVWCGHFLWAYHSSVPLPICLFSPSWWIFSHLTHTLLIPRAWMSVSKQVLACPLVSTAISLSRASCGGVYAVLLLTLHVLSNTCPDLAVASQPSQHHHPTLLQPPNDWSFIIIAKSG